MIFDFQKTQSILGGQFASFYTLQHILNEIRYLLYIVIHLAQQFECLWQIFLSIIIVWCLFMGTPWIENKKNKMNPKKKKMKSINRRQQQQWIQHTEYPLWKIGIQLKIPNSFFFFILCIYRHIFFAAQYFRLSMLLFIHLFSVTTAFDTWITLSPSLCWSACVRRMVYTGPKWQFSTCIYFEYAFAIATECKLGKACAASLRVHLVRATNNTEWNKKKNVRNHVWGMRYMVLVHISIL